MAATKEEIKELEYILKELEGLIWTRRSMSTLVPPWDVFSTVTESAV